MFECFYGKTLSANKIYVSVVAVILAAICLPPTCVSDSINVVHLSRNWTLTNQNGSISKTGISLPSGVYSALYGEKVLDSMNDVRQRWISYDNWTYTNAFNVNTTELKSIRGKNLTFYGIDTVAEIRLNHYLLGRTNNMFVRYSYDISPYLKAENILEIEIKSPVAMAALKAKELQKRGIDVPPNCPDDRYHGECHMNMLRKMQASFSWDWGLAAPSMGIWKSIALEYYDVALIRDVDVALSKNQTHWNMNIRVFLDCSGNRDFYAELTFYAVELLKTALIISDYVKKPISHKAPIIMFDLAVPIEDVTLWWPNGYGEQKLYPLHFTLKAWSNKSGASLRDKITSEKSIRIGFRTIELVEDAVPEGTGNTFLFEVNGKEIFMKGSNYIPSHILPEYSRDPDRIKHLLQSVKESHQNMIRVWGGGIYESDYFYDVADYFGILIWQDMMFACAMYPATDPFLRSVRTEVIQNAQRISYHASVAIFATNNENEVALVQGWYETQPNIERYEADYRKLYLATVIHELKAFEAPSRPRPLASSPSNGKESEKDNYISENPQDENYGDVHFYDYFEDGWSANIYPRPRFASEYGTQSLPGMQSWLRTMAASDQLDDLVDHRQHHPMGMLVITGLVRKHLPLPLPEDYNYMEALIYFSQISQAMATKVETELYRSLRDTKHRTMGALYWQLNDVWVAPSWSAIDFYGNYKLLHYWSRAFLAPISIVALMDSHTKTLNVSLICDQFEVDTSDLQVSMNIHKWSTLYPRKTTTWPVTLKPNGVQYDKVIPIANIIKGNFTRNNCFVEFVLQRGSIPLSSTFYFPSMITTAQNVKDPELDFEISYKVCTTMLSSTVINSFSLTLTAKYPAIFVYIELLLQNHPNILKYKLSDNGFMMTTSVIVVHAEFEAHECIRLGRSDIKLTTVNQYLIKSKK